MRTVKWGVLGTAYIFERDTAEGMKQAENCELYAIAGRSMEKAEAFKEKYGFQKAYGSYEDLLADPQVEAVYIPLPNTMHYEWTIKALKAKKHVLCEKPLAPTAKEAREMFETAREQGVLLMEAFAYQHSPYIAEIQKELERGTIGDVRYMEAALITSDYVEGNIRMRRETLGGSTYDLGVYCSSLILRMLGKEPERVQAVSTFSKEKVDMYTAVLMEYENGMRANFDCGLVLATEKNSALDRFQIHGTKGSIEAVKFGFNAPGELSYVVRTFEGMEEVKTVQVPQNYRLEVEQLGRCITEGETPAVSEAFSVANARIIDRILESIGY
ncbi:MAG: Gfo/Idh/MocA family oxidoreductase [Lachnospiraceae bacterium]|jgi:predicted dehydrogenase|uniref:Gfo/Idh/MocA family protein n=1 Tax=Candidatus Merdisoma sp. JLR.KK006 TaxID=3112626 RepID=UPI002FF28365|nr:Gfo/Idh/MocA family oxidoreductase [Lachnospiraceae bacterium]